jgi:Fur family iron response transcriptional regulator
MSYETTKTFSEVPETVVDWRTDVAGEEESGCPWHDCQLLLRRAGLRPTRQRLLLGWILFSKGDRHVSAEMIHAEAERASIPVSLATVYNTLNQFTKAGLLRQIGVNGSRAFFDTNPSAHHHFLVEGDETPIDMPQSDSIVVQGVPRAPDGFEIARIDVMVALRKVGNED